MPTKLTTTNTCLKNVRATGNERDFQKTMLRNCRARGVKKKCSFPFIYFTSYLELSFIDFKGKSLLYLSYILLQFGG